MRLTSRNVRSLDPGEYRDPLVPGLILRVTDSSRAWGFRYTFAGKRCRVELGPLERDKDHVAENIEQTRNLARNLVSGIVRGEDPRIALNRHGTDALTVPQLCGKAIADLDLKPRTREDWQNHLKRNIEKQFGGVPAAGLSRSMVRLWGQKILKRGPWPASL